MPRTGVSKDQIFAIADALTAEGRAPSVQGIREVLNTGSYSTIQKYLYIWREIHLQLSASATELPPSIIKVISNEIDRAKSEARLEINERLLVVQADSNDLADAFEAMELELEGRIDEISLLKADRDLLMNQNQKLASDIERLTIDSERERYSADQARTETAQLRNKVELQQEKLSELSSTIDTLKSLCATESQARHNVEKTVAVLTTKHESEQQRSGMLLQEKESMIVQVKVERQSAEAARIEAAKIASELEMQKVAMEAKEVIISELKELSELDRQARVVAEMKYAVLAAKQEIQGQDVIAQVQS